MSARPAPRAAPRLALLATAAAGALLASCAGAPRHAPPAAARPPYPAVRFAVVSDLHYFDPSLGTDAPELRKYIAGDRKMLVESAEILDEAIAGIRGSGVRFLLVPGDLTKDGERLDHEQVAMRLAGLARAGIEVFVVPGNHDIENPHAVRFTAAGPEGVDTVSPGEFAWIYRQFGYGQAIARDAGSLSYVAEPVPGLRLLAIDACRYDENLARGSPVTGGRLEGGTVRWIEEQLADAARLGARVIAFMHHGVVEHFRGQERYAGEYLIDDNRRLGRLLASRGVRVVFTGHFHAQDVTRASWGASVLYDVETGSLVTTPVPVRMVEADGAGRMSITTRRIQAIPSLPGGSADLQEHARTLARDAVISFSVATMRRLGVPQADAAALAPQIAEAFVAHLRGDEHFAGGQKLGVRELSLMGRLVVGSRARLVDELWNDLPPDDNDVTLDLADAGTGGAP